MQLCFDATRFSLGLREAVELAVAKSVPAVEYTFDAFDTTAKTVKLSKDEQQYLGDVAAFCKSNEVQIACIKLRSMLDTSDKTAVKQFQQMMQKLALVAKELDCSRIAFSLKPLSEPGWIDAACRAIAPVCEKFDKQGIKLVLSLSTPYDYRGLTLKQWRPLEPQECRDLIAGCEGLGLGFSAADCAWQNIDYLQLLPGLVAAIEHVEANDVEINRAMLVDSGLFGPLWWRYRRPGKGQVDWRQLIEALKLYDYKGCLSIHLDDEFIDDSNGDLEDSLDESLKLLKPLVKY